jgi:hypothetical protein
VQSAVLNKEVKKTERGINMADEKYVISKASFEDFYETQGTLVLIMEKMVDRIEKQDQVIMKFGAALTEVLAKGFEDAMEMPVQGMPEDENSVDFSEENVNVDEEEEEEVEYDEEGNPIVNDESEEEVEGEPVDVNPVQTDVPPMMETDVLKAEKSAFEAGYKAALAEMQKKNGVEITPLEVPATATTRPVVPAENPVAKTTTLDTIPEKDLANMTPNQINTWLREHKLYR